MSERVQALRDAADDFDRRRGEWYGLDIFPDLPDNFAAELDSWMMKRFGRRIDAVSGWYYRRVMERDAELLRQMADELAADERDHRDDEGRSGARDGSGS